ncbi:hypothetical protein [Anditalea andensis]|uniref:6-bladed beta-propeller n=1 Tax=Anditalea andensis TaxID=1048983 RepID=A0A074LH86_9BACT|nr:hypothetical protein [Anditalea andensis]KEO73122.1 hypothetical protein EL17_16055 [Anditalea andensis]
MFLITLFSYILFFQSCSPSDINDESAIREVPFELLDSLVIDVLEPLELDDYHEGNGLYLLRGKRKSVYLVDKSGRVVAKPDIIGNGPDQVGGSALGCQFLGDDKVVCMDANSRFHIYDVGFERKLRVLPSPMVDFNTFVVYHYRIPFRTGMVNAEPYIFGVEINAFSYADINPGKLYEEFYEQAKVVFRYDINLESLTFMESFPHQWIPRKDKIYVGESYPLSEFNRVTMEYAILPGTGDQLFVYDGIGTSNLKHVTDLAHPERAPLSTWITNGFNDPFNSYPRFNDLRMFGDYQIVKFNTQVPESVQRELRAGNENYGRSPEWHEALRKYFRPYYIIAKDGKQVGIINDFPAPGQMDYVSSDGTIFLNDNRKPSVERDYNVFYKVRMKNE